MNAKKIFFGVLAVLCISAVGIGIGATVYIYNQVKAFDKVFAKGVFVEDIDISGLTREQAKEAIESELENKNNGKKITLKKGEVSFDVPYMKLGIMYNIDEVLDEAYQIGHTGGIYKRYQYMSNPPVEPQVLNLSSGYDKESIYKLLEQYAKSFYKEPVDAKIERKNRKFIITNEVYGEELDQVATLENICTFLENNETGNVEVVTKAIAPKYTADSFKNIQNLVASFYTTYNNADPNRNVNLKVGSAKINTTVLPGETFALSKYLEPITYQGGYRSSKVIVNGKLEDGIGGGICQIASTLYNALLLTNIDITMRRNHSLPVAYVPLARDATYSTGTIDFQFKNNTQHPLFIESYCENNKLYVNLFGDLELKPKYTIKFDSVTTETIAPPATKYIEDPSLAAGQKVEEVKPLYGKKVKLYKLYYEGDKLIKKELVNDSYYRARGGVVKVGKKTESVPAFNPATDTHKATDGKQEQDITGPNDSSNDNQDIIDFDNIPLFDEIPMFE